jgi:NADPH:quinone reductase
MPKGYSFLEAAALPETFMTVWHNVFERGALRSGETLLIHGGSSGIGTTAIMLAKQFGAKVIVTAGSPEKCEACRKLGADVAIDYGKEDFVAATKQATGGKGADLILDMIGGDYVDRNFEAAAVEGRIVQIATQKGPKVTIDLRRLMLKRLTHTGSTLRARPVADKAAIARALQEQVWPLLESGKVRPVIDSTYLFAQAAEAHTRMETSLHIGKIMLEVPA